MDWLDPEYMTELVESYGAIGLFLVSLINNVIPGLPPFYLTVVSAYAVAGTANWYLGLISAGIGAGLGKVILFTSAGALVSRLGRGRKMRRFASRLLGAEKAKLSIALLVFVTASFPLPDDLIYIPLGAAAFSLSYFTAAVILGKLFLVSGAYALGSFYKRLLESAALGGPISMELAVALIAGSLILSGIMTLVLMSLDWEAIYTAYINRGGREAVKVLLIELKELVANFRHASVKP